MRLFRLLCSALLYSARRGAASGASGDSHRTPATRLRDSLATPPSATHARPARRAGAPEILRISLRARTRTIQDRHPAYSTVLARAETHTGRCITAAPRHPALEVSTPAPRSARARRRCLGSRQHALERRTPAVVAGGRGPVGRGSARMYVSRDLSGIRVRSEVGAWGQWGLLSQLWASGRGGECSQSHSHCRDAGCARFATRPRAVAARRGSRRGVGAPRRPSGTRQQRPHPRTPAPACQRANVPTCRRAHTCQLRTGPR